MAIASMPTSSEGRTEFPAHFALFKRKHKACVLDRMQKISTDKSKQTSTLLEIRNINKLSFKTCDSSFEHLLTYFSLLINGLLEMWLRHLTFYFRSWKHSQKIFSRSSLAYLLQCYQSQVQLVGVFSSIPTTPPNLLAGTRSQDLL